MAWLAAAALRSLLLAGMVGTGLAIVRTRHSATRLQIWTLVLYAALAMPALCLMLPRLPISLPLLPPRQMVVPLPPLQLSPSRDLSMAAPGAANAPAAGTAVLPTIVSLPPAASPQKRHFDWATLIAGIYLGGLLVLLVRLGTGIAWARRLMRKLRPVAELGSDVFESDAVAVPAAIGARRARVVLPPAWRGWEPRKLEAVLAHEREHIARGDGLTQRLALLHQALFWFSPLSWWLHGHLVELAEETSDEAVLRAGTEPALYAGVLLEFLEQLRHGANRVRWTEVGMARVRNSVNRLDKVLEWQGGEVMAPNRQVLAKLLVVAIPLVLAIGAVQPGLSSRGTPVPGRAQATELPSSAPAAPRVLLAATPVESQQAPIRVSSGVLPARCLSCPSPIYPADARAAGVEGTIWITGTIGTDGKLKDLDWQSGDPRLVAAAMEAVRRWVYSPMVLGQPIEAATTIAVMFNLAGQATPPAASGPGTLSVRVVDQTGAAIPGAIVALNGGGAGKEAFTRADGTHTFAELPAGNYSMGVTMRGFVGGDATVAVMAGSNTPIDFMLHVGNSRQTVEVTAESPVEVPQASSQAPVAMSAAVMAASCESCPPPVYPEQAKQAHAQGVVVLHVIIGTDGTVKSLEIVGSPDPMLATAAEQAVQSWHYRPQKPNGVPISVDTTIRVTFSLAQ